VKDELHPKAEEKRHKHERAVKPRSEFNCPHKRKLRFAPRLEGIPDLVVSVGGSFHNLPRRKTR